MLMTPTGLLSTTKELCVVDTTQGAKWPVFRLLKANGKLEEGVSDPKDITQELAVKMYSSMVQIQVMDDIMNLAQRQGRISFYMQASGEEAIHVGSASMLSPKDMVFSQYREQGVLLWRGFSIQEALDQCFSNENDLGKGRQMPVHYGSKALNFQTISSPLGTQLPQAVGAAYAYKMEKADAVSVCYFGEGAASEGDFHAALNFSATLEVPIVFFCRNNGYAISTPSSEQFRGDGIASRAVGYGIHAIRVDGNDLLAVRAATEEARRIAHTLSKPVLIEAMTYRAGHHSTSDDSTRYRGADEIKEWQDRYDPMKRFRTYMEDRGWWNEAMEQEVRDRERKTVLDCMEIAENRAKPAFGKLFEDVYATKPAHLLKQEEEMFAHVAKYPHHYNSDSH
eukprot:CAMPEP_0170395302 /NCGR_PEP_ID=MMETSP0117_2-20130122/21706_1 /TAXON_ID=400756 /ORGANISM="Durinskia baltica, Strain CSIRO CS-38" /LENGTH=394 /DNA_ID=CAMNT_0010651603 /DNA_START=134 /DNA_END=1318 /DNA_ORIENTATION=+